jgi:carbamoyltransferase
MKEVLNKKIKHREPFRPFAPSILKEYVGEYFETKDDSPFMLRVVKTRKVMRNKVPAIMHIDKTARVQTITSKDNGIYYELIKKFYRIAGVPVILNTSFNDSGEPIVETPKDAMVMFCKTPMDYLIMGNYLIWKE